MLAMRPRPRRRDREVQQDLAATYNQFKEFEGRKYTGMKVGRGHHWHHEKGDWKETKITVLAHQNVRKLDANTQA